MLQLTSLHDVYAGLGGDACNNRSSLSSFASESAGATDGCLRLRGGVGSDDEEAGSTPIDDSLNFLSHTYVTF